MTNRYETAATEVELQIQKLRARRARFAAHPTLHTRVAGVDAEIARLEALDLDQWRSTGRWANEIWGK